MNMRFCILGFFLLTGIVITVPISDDVKSKGGHDALALESTPARPLQLGVTIVRKKYCKGDPELDALQLDLGLKFSNIGPDSLILSKGSRIQRVIISRNWEDAKAKLFELNSSLTWVDDGKKQGIEGPVPNQFFTILRAGADYEMEASLTVFVRREDSPISGSIGAGEHILQVEVQTIPQGNYNMMKLRRQWKTLGLLWYQPILSDPVSLQVEKTRNLSDCQ